VAGLEVRGVEVAHEPSVWQRDEDCQAVRQLERRLDPTTLDAVLRVLGLVEVELSTADARAVLDELTDPHVLEAVVEVWLCTDEPARVAALSALARRLADAASRPGQRAVASWLLAVVAEREGRPDDGRTLLRDAVRSAPSWEPAVDRLAW
jgi:hypothetical protein